jgi:protein-disulfide isomerase
LVAAGLLAVSACGASKEDVQTLADQQRQILAKLGELEKKIDQGGQRTAQQRPSGPDTNKAYPLPVGKSPTRGPQNAPVTIVEFSDYQCPFCARSEPLIKEVLQAYPDQVNFVYKHFPLVSIHPMALGAAQAAVAAQKQGKFWEMHDVLFANQRALQPEKLKEYAQQIGLDVGKFETDMNADDTKALIQEDVRLAQQAQVRGTPTIFVNGKLVQNRSVDGFKQLIDESLKAKQAG